MLRTYGCFLIAVARRNPNLLAFVAFVPIIAAPALKNGQSGGKNKVRKGVQRESSTCIIPTSHGDVVGFHEI